MPFPFFLKGMLYRSSPSGPSQVLVPTSYQIAGNQIYQVSVMCGSRIIFAPFQMYEILECLSPLLIFVLLLVFLFVESKCGRY